VRGGFFIHGEFMDTEKKKKPIGLIIGLSAGIPTLVLAVFLIWFFAFRKEPMDLSDFSVLAQCGSFCRDSYDFATEWSDVQVVDPFDWIVVDFSGIAPRGNASYEFLSHADIMDHLIYRFYNNKDLKYGDKVKILLECDLSEAKLRKEFGYIFSCTEKEYTVEGIPRYIMAIKDIPEETTEAVNESVEELFKREFGENFVESKFLGNYLYILINHSIMDKYNRIYYVYEITVKNAGKNQTFYVAPVYYGVTLDENGNDSINPNALVFSGEVIIAPDGIHTYTGYPDFESMEKSLSKDAPGNFAVFSSVEAE
jgi:hypothetical protein